MLLISRMSRGMLLFNLCKKKRLAILHMNGPLFPKTLSIPSYDIGKYVGLRTYQHPLVYGNFSPFGYYGWISTEEISMDREREAGFESQYCYQQ